MKTRILLLVTIMTLSSAFASAETTINKDNRYAYGANIGWMDARGDVYHGAVIGEYVCSGYIYAANIGWICLGDGSPANGIHYQNGSATDYGVNHDGTGKLRGYGYGANIGWINFEATGAPTVDLSTGHLSGYMWSANCGWISLANAYAFVQTDNLEPGADSDIDGIADAWELAYTKTLTALAATGDADGDGRSDYDESIADTNPLDPFDLLRIIDYTHDGGTYNQLWWTSKPTRFYRVIHCTSLDTGTWEPWTSLLPRYSGIVSVGFDDFNSNDFFRIQVVKPLMP